MPLPRRVIRFITSAFAAAGVVSQLAAPVGASPPETAPPVAGSIGLRLVDVPAVSSMDPRAQLYIIDHLAPGAVIARRIEVSNGTTTTAHVALYPSAAEIVDNVFVGSAARTSNELSTWTAVTPDAVDVATNGRSTAIITISVPADAASGERYGVVWAEVSAGPTAGEGVTNVSRVGVRLYVSVGAGGPPAADFEIESLTAARSAEGVPSITTTVHNTGGRALDISGSLQLDAGPAGLRAGPFPATLGTTLAIGGIEPITIVLDKLVPAGSWDAVITLRSGMLERTAHAAIILPSFGTGEPVNISPPSRDGTLLRVIGCLLGALVIGGSVLTIRKLRRPQLAV
jgi:hypothetical protein